MSYQKPYLYHCVLKRVKDGDSYLIDLDLGTGQWTHDVDLRLYACDTPENRAVKGNKKLKAYGLTVTKYVQELLTIGETYVIKTHKDQRGKFGRILAEIYHKADKRGLGKSLNQHLIDKRYAMPYHGESKSQVTEAHTANLKALLKDKQITLVKV